MIKEQEVIKRLNFHKEYARLSSNKWTDLETVLNMLKEKDKEIKTLTQTNKSYKGMIRKKDRQINYMANFINDNTPYTKELDELIRNLEILEKDYTEEKIYCNEYLQRKQILINIYIDKMIEKRMVKKYERKKRRNGKTI